MNHKISSPTDPLIRFDEWFQDATQRGEVMPEKMVVATSTLEGRPSVRYVLLKGRLDRWFYFYTNYMSRKSSELDQNPLAALAFYWPKLDKQIRIEGRVCRTTEKESDLYWSTRPRESQIGAWASRQSQLIRHRDEIESKIKDFETKFSGREVPRPEFWGGFKIEAARFEFWTGHRFRVHDREIYEWSEEQWRISRLSP